MDIVKMSHVKSKISFLFILLFFTGIVFAQLKPVITLNEKPAVEYSKISKRTQDYKYFIMFGAGISLPAGNMVKYKGGFTANISFSPYSNGSLGLRFDANYLSMKINDVIVENNGYGFSNTSIVSSDWLTIYNLKIEMLFGNLKPRSNFNIYGFSGIGIESRSGGKKHMMWINANDTLKSDTQGDEGGALRFNFGSGINYRLTNNFRLFAELQYDMCATEILNFYPQTSTFILRSGIFINF